MYEDLDHGKDSHTFIHSVNNKIMLIKQINHDSRILQALNEIQILCEKYVMKQLEDTYEK